jgi:short-subunit dehydrogenase
MGTKTQIVLITGATAGIGRHMALHLAKRGHHVIAAGRRQHALDTLEAEAAGLRLDTVQLDVTDEASVRAGHASVLAFTADHGVDVIVNNAGYGMAAPTIETRDEDMRKQFDTNVFGLMSVTRVFAQEMLQRRQGRIVNISSVGGRVTLPFMGVYNSTKYAVESLSDAMRRELHALGIQVALVEPGLIRSEFSERTMEWVEQYKDSTSPFARIYERSEEMRRWSDSQAADPLCVSQAVQHAIEAKRSRARYLVPFSSRIMVWLAGWLPTRLLDLAMVRALGLSANTREALPPAPSAA